VSVVKTINSPHWQGITFQVRIRSSNLHRPRYDIFPITPRFFSHSYSFHQIFDVPSRGTDTFEDRLSWLQNTFGQGGTHAVEQIAVVEHEVAKGREHVLQKLKEVETLGGEGLMLREPGSYVLLPCLL
jgi:DNA ligase-1